MKPRLNRSAGAGQIDSESTGQTVATACLDIMTSGTYVPVMDDKEAGMKQTDTTKTADGREIRSLDDDGRIVIVELTANGVEISRATFDTASIKAVEAYVKVIIGKTAVADGRGGFVYSTSHGAI